MFVIIWYGTTANLYSLTKTLVCSVRVYCMVTNSTTNASCSFDGIQKDEPRTVHIIMCVHAYTFSVNYNNYFNSNNYYIALTTGTVSTLLLHKMCIRDRCTVLPHVVQKGTSVSDCGTFLQYMQKIVYDFLYMKTYTQVSFCTTICLYPLKL